MAQRILYVYADWEWLEGPVRMGKLSATAVRGKEVFSFEYDEEWLRIGNSQNLDPDLQLYSGPQYLADEKKSNFGLFLDSSPDRWGRILVQRREAVLARQEGRKERTLFETDYLLGVYDGHRMGGLRFKEDQDGPFLNNNKGMASPPWTSIRELEHASLKLEEEGSSDEENLKWLNLLIAPGSSLGGARPKASVVDEKGQLWIAKFPSARDTSDIGAWEIVANELAAKAGISVPNCKAASFYSKRHTFLTQRFDRTGKSDRIHFASAMTLLGHTDGTSYEDGVSYLDIAGFIMQHGADVDSDLEELWRRIVFYICISNTDDHLRNHGFLLTPRGWTLSPAYDINPVKGSVGLSLNISETDNALDLALATEVAEYFRIGQMKSKKIISSVKEAVSNWEEVADKYGISRTEKNLMRSAFQY